MTVDNDGLLTAAAPAHAAGVVDVAVSTGTGCTATVESGFTYTALPIIRSLTPETGTSGTVVTITGENFTGVGHNRVAFGDLLATPSSVSDTSLTVSVPARVVKSNTPVNVTVTNDAGPTTAGTTFTYLVSLP